MAAGTSPQLVGAEFSRLTATATTLLDELREYPAYGRLWESHFNRTFDHFMRLWRMQQQYRQILERQEVYGLQRSEIGQIASKIGQLYYYLYLRTGDLRFLKESLVFYTAIHLRGYFDMPESQSPRMLHARLRYFARYVVVTLLFDKLQQAQELAKELQRYVDDFAKLSGSSEPTEWDLLVAELTRFLAAENLVRIAGLPADCFLSRRLPARLPGFETRPHIDQAILVSNFSHQIKFSELTLDTYRVCHLLESDADASSSATTTAAATTAGGSDDDAPALPPSGAVAQQVAKQLLYRPTVAKLLSTLAQSHAALSRSAAVLFVYLSADGVQHPSVALSSAGAEPAPDALLSSSSSSSSVAASPLLSPRQYRSPLHPSDDASFSPTSSTADAELVPSSPSRRSRRTSSLLSPSGPTSFASSGGLAMNSPSPSSVPPSSNSLSVDILYAHDLIPFLRRPFFLVVDSDNSGAFKSLRPFFNQPLVCLLSPEAQPLHIKDSTHSGNLFTFFLYDPVTALAFVCGLDAIDYAVYTACQKVLVDAFADTDPLYDSVDKVPQSVKFMVQDFALKTIFFRFLFCYSALSYHKAFTSPRHLPAIAPALPQPLLLNPIMRSALVSLASLLDIQQHFIFPS